jgi:hypothetical protein
MKSIYAGSAPFPKSIFFHKFLQVFLPIGYPNSVSSDYPNYQFWDSLQAFFSSLTGLLAKKCILKALGVGDAEASSSAATMVQLVTDAVAMTTNVVFAHSFAPNFQKDVKTWRFMADILNDLGLGLEFLAVSVDKSLFLYVAAGKKLTS